MEKVYFQSLSLENVRCFGKKQEISFLKEDGSIARWNIILGENGTGKTTILKSLAMLEAEYHTRTSNFNVDSIDFSYFIRNKANLPYFRYSWLLNPDDKSSKREIGISTHILDRGNGIESISDSSEVHPFVLVGYGAARIIGESSISSSQFPPKKTEYTFKAKSLFDESTPLLNAEEWLIQADYQALKNEAKTNKREKIESLLLQLFEGEISAIKIQEDPIGVLFKTDYGWVRLHQLSLGYKTLIAWMVDFASKLYELYPDTDNPLAQPAIVLIDEIDLHLHPKFQQNLIQFLSKTFPNTQFIATAHSPLIVQAAEDANVILLKKEDDEVTVDNDPINVNNWRVDQILVSDLFNLGSSRSPSKEALMKKRRKILGQATLTKEDELEVQRLEKAIGDVPVGETKEEIKAFEVIKDFAKIIQELKESKHK